MMVFSQREAQATPACAPAPASGAYSGLLGTWTVPPQVLRVLGQLAAAFGLLAARCGVSDCCGMPNVTPSGSTARKRLMHVLYYQCGLIISTATPSAIPVCVAHLAGGTARFQERLQLRGVHLTATSQLVRRQK